MIAWSIEAAQRSGLFDHIIVSTEDKEIADVARSLGAEVPFIRPDDLADDITGPTRVMAHTVKWAMDSGWDVKAVCCIYATAPFIADEDLKKAYEMFTNGDWAFSFPVTKFTAPIFRSFKVLPDGSVEMFYPEHFSTRSQDLPAAFHDVGQFYWGKPDSWLKEKVVFGPHSTALIIPKWRVQDIDDEDDWARAEMLGQLILKNKENYAI